MTFQPLGLQASDIAALIAADDAPFAQVSVEKSAIIAHKYPRATANRRGRDRKPVRRPRYV